MCFVWASVPLQWTWRRLLLRWLVRRCSLVIQSAPGILSRPAGVRSLSYRRWPSVACPRVKSRARSYLDVRSRAGLRAKLSCCDILASITPWRSAYDYHYQRCQKFNSLLRLDHKILSRPPPRTISRHWSDLPRDRTFRFTRS